MKTFVTGIALSLILGFSATSRAADETVAAGKSVKVDYTLTVDNEQIETSVGKKPLEFVVGDKSIIPGLESGLVGMHVGEEKIITLAPKDAYGESDPKALKEFPKTSMPKDVDLKVGMVLQAQAPDGESFPATITQIKDDKVTLNFNHPLAGKQLQFKVKVLNVETAPAVPVAAAPLTPAK
jgi:FKBP-type peptidyl-prolyl cis-trans isomerase SlyD